MNRISVSSSLMAMVSYGAQRSLMLSPTPPTLAPKKRSPSDPSRVVSSGNATFKGAVAGSSVSDLGTAVRAKSKIQSESDGSAKSKSKFGGKKKGDGKAATTDDGIGRALYRRPATKAEGGAGGNGRIIGDTPMSLNSMLSGTSIKKPLPGEGGGDVADQEDDTLPPKEKAKIIDNIDDIREDGKAGSTGGDKGLIIDNVGYLGTSDLVYSPINNRILSIGSPVVRSLLAIGFGIDTQKRELVISRPKRLNEYAQQLRSGAADLPKCWKLKMISELGYILSSPRIENPSEHVEKLIQQKKLTKRNTIGFVSGTGAESASAAERAAQEESSTLSISLNKEQREILDMAAQGYHMYVGGCAGTGKTVLLTALKRRLTSESLRVAMTATTGIAGCHIGGATFHHTFSVNTNNEFANTKNLLSYDVVIIDEVSMLSRRLFEEFDIALRHEAGVDIPFGGVQIILCGDFLQLCPVNEELLIDSPLFTKNFVMSKLIQQVRQSEHPKYAEYLSMIRLGNCPPETRQLIKESPSGELLRDAVNLLPTNEQVREANQSEVDLLPSVPFKLVPKVSEVKLEGEYTPTILMDADPSFNIDQFKALAFAFISDRVSMRNAHGMSIYRLNATIVAFRIAVPTTESTIWKRAFIQRFLELPQHVEKWPVGKLSVTNVVPDGNGLHTQEMEDDLAKLMKNHPVVQDTEVKEGCRVLLRSNLTTNLVNGSIGVVKGFCPCEKEYVHKFLRTDPSQEALIQDYAAFHEIELGYPAMLPMVQFSEGMPPLAIPPVAFKIGGTIRTQFYALEGIMVPLSLAYAFTVHKVQGLTLCGKVHLELSKMWPCNHLLYVAMSRVKNPEQLSMSGFDEKMVVADPNAVQFDRWLHGQPDTCTIPANAPRGMWKGFEQFTITQEFHKALGKGAFQDSVIRAHNQAMHGAAVDGGLSGADTTIVDDGKKPSSASAVKGTAVEQLRAMAERRTAIAAADGVDPGIKDPTNAGPSEYQRLLDELSNVPVLDGSSDTQSIPTDSYEDDDTPPM